LDDRFVVIIRYSVYNAYHRDHEKKKETHTATWADIFARIAPDLLQYPSDAAVNSLLAGSVYRTLHPTGDANPHVDHDCFQTIKLQLAAHDLVSVSYTKTTKGDMALFWSLTPRGQKVMLQLRTVKKASNKPSEGTR
jgi:hypothetical protein